MVKLQKNRCMIIAFKFNLLTNSSRQLLMATPFYHIILGNSYLQPQAVLKHVEKLTNICPEWMSKLLWSKVRTQTAEEHTKLWLLQHEYGLKFCKGNGRSCNTICITLLHLCVATKRISRMRPTSPVQNWIKQV
jgi:hypothetical protein